MILNLNHNKISVIHNRAFEGLDTLEILTLYENKISVIEPEAFRGLDKWVLERFSEYFNFNPFPRKLRRLNLGGNHLTAIPQRALSIFDTLKKLEVQENQIDIITEGDFEGLRNLDSLILAHNKLKEIPANVFSHLKQLNSLELEGNLITYVDKDAFSGLEGESRWEKAFCLIEKFLPLLWKLIQFDVKVFDAAAPLSNLQRCKKMFS